MIESAKAPVKQGKIESSWKRERERESDSMISRRGISSSLPTHQEVTKIAESVGVPTTISSRATSSSSLVKTLANELNLLLLCPTVEKKNPVGEFRVFNLTSPPRLLAQEEFYYIWAQFRNSIKNILR